MKDIRIIELELFNYCNRRCSWCPNIMKPERQNTYQQMSLDTVKRLVDDINSAGYEGYISFSRYNEPMYRLDCNEHIFRYIKDNTKCKLVTNTNGDFFRGDDIAAFSIACNIFDSITIMMYDGFSFDLTWLNEYEVDEETNSIFGKVGNCEVALLAPNFEINDRGGLLKEYSNIKREEKCYEPLRFLAIDYNGNVMPCCNMRSDFEEHIEYSYGNINDESILDILKKERVIKIRNGEICMKPCEFCIKKPGRHTRDNPGIRP